MNIYGFSPCFFLTLGHYTRFPSLPADASLLLRGSRFSVPGMKGHQVALLSLVNVGDDKSTSASVVYGVFQELYTGYII